MANTVSQMGRIQVRRIGAVVDAPFAGQGFHLVIPATQERSNHPHPGVDGRRIRFPHAAQPRRARAPEQPEQEEFRLIPGVMSQGDPRAAVLPRNPGQEAVSKPARRRFPGLAGCARGFHIRGAGDEGQTSLRRGHRHEGLVRVGVGPAQLMMKVRHHQAPTLVDPPPHESAQQHHGVPSARHRHDHPAAGRQASTSDRRRLESGPGWLHGVGFFPNPGHVSRP